MELRLLGEVELRAAGQVLDVGAPRPQAVLAALAVDAGRPVAIETFIDRVWDANPPAEVRNVLYSHLSRIRRLLRQAATLTGEMAVQIERRHAGYVLDIDPDLVDLHRFRRLVEQDSDPQRDDSTRAAALAEALGLWQGPPLAGLPGRWAGQVRDSWDRRRLDAVVQWAQIELRLAHPAKVINTLPDLVTEYPLVEPLEALLMRALHAAGRGAEALCRYSSVRQRLADELGTDPGPELRALHQDLLRSELPPPSRGPVPAAVRTVLPATPQPEPAASIAAAGQRAPEPATAGGSELPGMPNAGLPTPDHADLEPDPNEKPQPLDAFTTDTPPRRTHLRPTRRRIVLAALVVAILLTASGSVPILNRDKDPDSPSIEHAQALFAIARKIDQDGRARDAQEVIVDAVQLYDELIKLNPDQNAPPLAPAIIQALGRAGVDFSVADTTLRTWLANPGFTPYPAVSQFLLLQGWRLKAPVYLDVIVWNYEHAPGITSPRSVADINPSVLKAAVLEGSNARYGTRVTDFEQLLEH
jgi:DNA-binding SARP family transcriptional activator